MIIYYLATSKELQSDTITQCPQCSKAYKINEGIVIETYFNNGEERCYGQVSFCSITCLLISAVPEGECQ